MKSKISCFNKTIFRKNLTHFWPLWAIYTCYLLVVLPANIWLHMTAEYMSETYNQISKQYSALHDTFRFALWPVPVFVFAVIVAMAVFSYLYTARNANMIHSLPVDRKELFVTNYISGLLFIIIPEIFTFIVSVFVCIACQVTSIQFLFYWFICMMGMSFFAFSMAVLVAMFTGQIFALPVYYFVANYLYVGCLYIISRIVSVICYGVSDAWNPGKSCVLSPVYYLNNNLRSSVEYNEAIGQLTGLSIKGGSLVLIYVVAGVIFMLAAYQMYKRRQIETAGDIVSIPIIKPIFRWGVALCGSFLLAILLSEMITVYTGNLDIFIFLLLFVVFFGFVCFFVAEMLLQKNFRVFKKKRLLEWLGFTAIAVALLGSLKLDVFRLERSLPKADDVKIAFVDLDYPLPFEGDGINEILRIHQQVISEKQNYLGQPSENCYYTTFRYFLKDGTVFERVYRLPVTDEFMKDETSPMAEIYELESKEENMKKQILGTNYETNEYYSGYVEVYGDDGRSDMHAFSEKELKLLVEAATKDIEQGNLEQYFLYSKNGYAKEDEDTSYFNGISFSYYNPNGVVNEAETYFYNYQYRQERVYAEWGNQNNSSAYITFGPNCTNIIEALEDLDIINDEWHLLTYEEYSELVDW